MHKLGVSFLFFENQGNQRHGDTHLVSFLDQNNWQMVTLLLDKALIVHKVQGTLQQGTRFIHGDLILDTLGTDNTHLKATR